MNALQVCVRVTCTGRDTVSRLNFKVSVAREMKIAKLKSLHFCDKICKAFVAVTLFT